MIRKTTLYILGIIALVGEIFLTKNGPSLIVIYGILIGSGLWFKFLSKIRTNVINSDIIQIIANKEINKKYEFSVNLSFWVSIPSLIIFLFIICNLIPNSLKFIAIICMTIGFSIVAASLIYQGHLTNLEINKILQINGYKMSETSGHILYKNKEEIFFQDKGY